MKTLGNKLVKVLKSVLIAICAIIVLAELIFFIMRAIKSQQAKITTENGIEKIEYLELGGIKQRIMIRGEDQKNPVILFLHGGPGNPILSYASYMQKGLEDDYTFVHWEQRGCGDTYYKNIYADVTEELLMTDLDELVDILRERFQKNKIIIMGHSWGTVLGTQYCKEHPEKVLAYIGTGQVIDFTKGTILASNQAIDQALQAGNDEDVNKLKQYLEEYQNHSDYENIDWNNFDHLKELQSKYLSSQNRMSFTEQMYLFLMDKATNFNEARWAIMKRDKFAKIEKNLEKYLFNIFHVDELGYEYTVPFYLIEGDTDWVSPYPLVQEFYKKVQAPEKQLYMVKDSGHSLFMEQQEQFQTVMEEIKDKLSVIE